MPCGRAKLPERKRSAGKAGRSSKARLSTLPLLKLGQAGSMAAAPFIGAVESDLPLTMVCSSLDALLYMAKDGRGIACVPDFAVKDDLANGRLRSLIDTYISQSESFHIVWASSRQMSPKVRVFVDFVVENFSEGLVAKAGEQRGD